MAIQMTTGGAVIGGIGVAAALALAIGDIADYLHLTIHSEAWATLLVAALGAQMHIAQKKEEYDEQAPPAPESSPSPPAPPGP